MKEKILKVGAMGDKMVLFDDGKVPAVLDIIAKKINNEFKYYRIMHGGTETEIEDFAIKRYIRKEHKFCITFN